MAKLVKPENALKKKVGDGGFKKEDLEKAQKAIDENDVDFVPIANQYLVVVREILASEKTGSDLSDLYSAFLDPLMQLRSQGSLFHYSSITCLTDIVVDCLDSLKMVDKTIIEIIVAYDKSAKALMAAGIRDQNHPICQALAKELGLVCQKYKASKA